MRSAAPPLLPLAALILLAVPLPSRSDDRIEGPGRPNVVVILFDDLGYSDLGCYGGEIETPALDSLAREGLRFTRFYNTSRCAPSRAALLTGRYPHEVGLGWLTNDFGHPGYREQIDGAAPLLPELLSDAGYHCYMVGKWHLCQVNPETGAGPRENWPLRRGFDRFYGTIYGTGSYWRPPTLARDDAYIDHDKLPDDYYYTRALGHEAAAFVREHAESDSDKPFFLYFAQFAPHSPLHALEEDIARYRGKYDNGPEAIRDRRLDRQVAEGLFSAEERNRLAEEFIADPEIPAWESLDEDTRAYLARKMEIYAAQVHRADLAVAELLAALDETGQRDRTLILALSDNGGAHTGGALGLRDDTREIPLEDRNSNHYIGRLWSGVSNAPFRMYKAHVHEGGIASPLIVNWPGRLAAPGSVVDQPAHIVDLLPTILDLADAAPGPEVHPTSRGRSLSPWLTSPATEKVSREFHFEHEGRRALILGDWKALWPTPDGPWELYHLPDDRIESRDLAEEHPERLERMSKRWLELAEEYQVLDYFPAPWAE